MLTILGREEATHWQRYRDYCVRGFGSLLRPFVDCFRFFAYIPRRITSGKRKWKAQEDWLPVSDGEIVWIEYELIFPLSICRMSVATRPNVRPFGPRVPFPNTFVKSDDFRNFLLTKGKFDRVWSAWQRRSNPIFIVINSEAAALQAPAFKEKIKRTKDAFLKELIKANK